MLDKIVAWVKHHLAPRCVDCNGKGYRAVSIVPGPLRMRVPCRLCRGTGRIFSDQD